ncbi:MAG: hypothetical protein HOD92_22285 [Deltaproteobacteria bacterium]|jgi:hypothetical protein|nr:hypothetical protein [Deltaproteobacteria bacterium]
MFSFKKILPVFLMFVMVSSIGFAGDLANFHNKLDEAYAPYRMSLSLTNKKDKQEAAIKTMNAFTKKWAALSSTYLNNPPAPYNESPLWKSTITKTSEVMKEGLTLVKAGKLKAGHKTIEAIRGMLGKLRKSVSIRNFSDYVNTYHTEMEHLVGVKYSKQNLNAKAIIKLREKVAVLRFLMNEAKAATPKKYSENATFQKFLNGNIKLLQLLHQSLEKGDKNKVLAILPKIKPAYGKLFIKFG